MVFIGNFSRFSTKYNCYQKGTWDNHKIGKSVGGKTSKLSVIVLDEKTVLKAELLSGNKHGSN